MSRRRPGNGSATLLDMLSNLFYFSPLPSGGGGWRDREEERGRERARGTWESHPPPAGYPPRTHRRHFPISRQAAASSLARSHCSSFSAFPGFHLASSHSSGSFLRRCDEEEREKGRERGRGTKREKGDAEGGWSGLAGAAMERESAVRSFGTRTKRG